MGGGFTFDFEGADFEILAAGGGVEGWKGTGDSRSGGSSSLHQIVCRHWLRDMCIKGDSCDFLHIYDDSRMPICRAYRKHGHCADDELGLCPLRHDAGDGDMGDYGEGSQHPGRGRHAINSAHSAHIDSSGGLAGSKSSTEICRRFLFGYCSFGPTCTQRHVQLPRDRCPQDAPLPDWYLSFVVSNLLVSPPQGGPPPPMVPSADHQGIIVIPSLDGLQRRSMNEKWSELVNQIVAPTAQTRCACLDDILPSDSLCPNGRRKNQIPPGQARIRCFVIKSGKIENILTSVQRGIWATGKGNVPKLEEAFRTCDHVILLMSANESGGFQGYARMASGFQPTLYPKIWGTFSAKLSDNFRVQWLKQCKLDFEALASFTNPWNENKPLKKSRDGQEMPIDLAEAICLRLDALPEADLLLGTPLQELAKINHKTFFTLTPQEQEAEEMRLGLRQAPAPPPPGAYGASGRLLFASQPPPPPPQGFT